MKHTAALLLTCSMLWLAQPSCLGAAFLADHEMSILRGGLCKTCWGDNGIVDCGVYRTCLSGLSGNVCAEDVDCGLDWSTPGQYMSCAQNILALWGSTTTVPCGVVGKCWCNLSKHCAVWSTTGPWVDVQICDHMESCLY